MTERSNPNSPRVEENGLELEDASANGLRGPGSATENTPAGIRRSPPGISRNNAVHRHGGGKAGNGVCFGLFIIVIIVAGVFLRRLGRANRVEGVKISYPSFDIGKPSFNWNKPSVNKPSVNLNKPSVNFSKPSLSVAKPEKGKGAEFYAYFLFKEPWVDSMSSTSSYTFRSLARKLQNLIDQIYSLSPLRHRFHNSKVIRLSKHDWNRIHVASVLKMKDMIRTYYVHPHVRTSDLKLSFIKGINSLLVSHTVQTRQKAFASKLVYTQLTVTSTDITTTTTTTSTTVRPARIGSKTNPVWKPYSTAKPQDVPCGEVRVLPDLRITGGSEVKRGEYPWMVMILKNTLTQRQQFSCGGSILDHWNILTAAHCLELEPQYSITGIMNTVSNQITVLAGRHLENTSSYFSQEQRILARAVYMHPNYSLNPIKNDIAVIRLSRPLQFNSRVTPLCLPDSNDPLPAICVVAGWGSLYDKTLVYPKALRSATLRAYNSSECERTFGPTFSRKGHSIDHYLGPGIMCASNSTFGGKDTCKGDSGGPLYCLQSGARGGRRYAQFGVVSSGVGCGLPGKPGFYTFLPHYVSWLRSQALPYLDRYASSRRVPDRLCQTFSPASDYRLWQCWSKLTRLRLGNDCSNVDDVVRCMVNELEQRNYQCPWREVYNTVVASLGQRQQQRCQAANSVDQPNAVCHNLTAVSQAVSHCTEHMNCVSMLEVTLCVHSRLDPRWLQCTRQKLKKFISTHLSDSLPICQDYTVRKMADGRQFVYLGGDWHVLCGDHWGHHEVKVACAQQGYQNGRPSLIRKTKETMYVSDHGNSMAEDQSAVKASGWLSVTCSGNESSLAECDLNRQATCASSYLAASICYNTAYNFTLSAPHPGTHYGYIHLTRDEGEGYVCVPDLSDLAAHQLCREVGYVTGMVYSRSLAPPTSPAIWETEMQCGYGAVDVSGCASGKWTRLQRGSGSCALAKVFCFATEAQLHNGLHNNTGIVQMYRPSQNGHDVTLKTVCRQGFDDVSAGILCRQLGFSGASRPLSFNPFFKPTTAYVSVDCKGKEGRLEECDVHEGDRNVCTEPAAVRCSSQPRQEADLSVRLSPTGSEVQVFTGGQWGTVCTDHWTDKEANTICRQLGHRHGYRRFRPFEASTGRDWPHVMHGLRCGVGAASLQQCSYQPVTSDLCQHVRAAAVLCSNSPKPVYTLHKSNTSRPNKGQVHVNYKGTSAPLRAYITNATASALCQAMGYVTGEKMVNVGLRYHTRKAHGQVWVLKHGHDCADVEQCLHVQPELIHCDLFVKDNSCLRPVVSVRCYTSAARLHTGARQTSGIVQLYRKGRWWEVCHDDVTQAAADVICHEVIGSPTASAVILRDVYRGGTLQRIKATSFCDPRDPGMTSADCLVVDATSKCDSFNNDSASVLCYEGPKPSGAISDWKLEGGALNSRVLVKRFGVWGTVCDDVWWTQEAQLLCKHLGYRSGTFVYMALKHVATTPMWAWSVQCNQTTSHLDKCHVSLTNDVTGSCRLNKDATVNCYRSYSYSDLVG